MCEEDRCDCDLWEKMLSYKYELYNPQFGNILAFTNQPSSQGYLMIPGDLMLPDGTKASQDEFIVWGAMQIRRNSLLPFRRIEPTCECPEPFTYFVVKWMDGQTPPEAHKQNTSRPFDMRKMQKEKTVQGH